MPLMTLRLGALRSYDHLLQEDALISALYRVGATSLPDAAAAVNQATFRELHPHSRIRVELNEWMEAAVDHNGLFSVQLSDAMAMMQCFQESCGGSESTLWAHAVQSCHPVMTGGMARLAQPLLADLKALESELSVTLWQPLAGDLLRRVARLKQVVPRVFPRRAKPCGDLRTVVAPCGDLPTVFDVHGHSPW